MGVLAIWRYPVKAMLGEALEWVDVAAGGLAGDRRWVVEDEATGERIAGKRGPTDPRLRACRARIESGVLVVTLPDGETTARGPEEAAEALSELLGRRVRLTEHPGGGDRFAATGGHHDFGPVHVLTTSALARMRAAEPQTDWDARRFRPNLVLDDDADAPDAPDAPEARLVGATLEGPSRVRLRVGVPTPRCVVPTRASEELPHDPRLLRALARTNRWDVGPFGGRQPCLGVYAEVARPGRLATADTMTLTPRADEPAEAAVARTIAEVVARLTS